MQTDKVVRWRNLRGFLGVLFLTCLACAPPARAVDVTLVPAGTTWKYLDNGSNQGTAWRPLSFDDSAWPSGPAQLGYGDGDEATALAYGPDANNKYITTYFRRVFTVADASVFSGLTLKLLRDDGAVVYLNGTEVWRSNMPAGGIGYQAVASVAVGGADESTWFQTTLSPALLVNGPNVLAVELHQSGGTSFAGALAAFELLPIHSRRTRAVINLEARLRTALTP